MTVAYSVVFYGLLAYFVVLNATYLFLILGSAREIRRRMAEAESPELPPGPELAVSVVIPAHNEEAVIVDCVRSVLDSDYESLEVIVVSDGSTDRTIEVMREEYAMVEDVSPPLRDVPSQPVRAVYRSQRFKELVLVDKANGGSADACNAGLSRARHPYIAHTDADCFFERDTLTRTMRAARLDPETVVAIGGHLRLANGSELDRGRVLSGSLPRRLVERLQVLEYQSAFLIHRPGWGLVNSAPVVAGGFGIWRADVVLELGGFSTEVTHEDLETTWAFHHLLRKGRRPYRIEQLPDPIVWTHVPSTWGELIRQRTRWQRVVYEVVWRYRRMLFNPRYGVVGLVGYPHLLAYEAAGPFIEVFSYAFVVALVIGGMLNGPALVVFCIFSFGLITLLRMVALLLDVLYFDSYGRRDLLRLIAIAFLEPFFYRFILLPFRMWALVEFFIGRKTHARTDRTGFGAEAGA